MHPSSTAEMLHLINGFHVSRALYVAATLGLADLLRAGEKTCAELALATHTNSSALHRVIRVLASAGIFALLPGERVAMTALSATLLTDTPGSLRGWAIGQLGGEHYQAWGELMHSVRTGEYAFEHAFGTTPWAYRAEHAQSAKEFDDGMASYIEAHHQAVLAAYSFAEFPSVYDIGGGDGQFLNALLTAYPKARGALLELPHVAAKARQRLHDADLLGRCEVLEGDIFESIPQGGSVYVLSRVIHDWHDAQAQRILAVCRKAMEMKSVLLLIERIMPPEIACDPATRALAVSDLNMLVMTGGCERTAEQYRELLDRAGFSLTSISATNTSLSVIEARPK
jgi:O-methyltransferase domain/Dimerisation domain